MDSSIVIEGLARFGKHADDVDTAESLADCDHFVVLHAVRNSPEQDDWAFVGEELPPFPTLAAARAVADTLVEKTGLPLKLWLLPYLGHPDEYKIEDVILGLRHLTLNAATTLMYYYKTGDAGVAMKMVYAGTGKATAMTASAVQTNLVKAGMAKLEDGSPYLTQLGAETARFLEMHWPMAQHMVKGGRNWIRPKQKAS